MMRNGKIFLTALCIAAGTLTFAGDHCHAPKDHGNDGLALAAGIVNLVNRVIAPRPVVVTPPPPPPAPRPVVMAPPPPPHCGHHHCR